jgi:polysaccharide export outer membrane protein
MPGDRLYVKAYRATAVDVTMARLFAPVERVLGITLLGTSTAKQIRFFNQFNSTGGNGSGGIVR